MAELERHAAEDQRQQHEENREIEGGQQRSVGCGEGGKEPAAAEDEPCLVAIPDGCDGGLHLVAFVTVFREGEEDADAEIEAIKRGVEEDGGGYEEGPDGGEVAAEHDQPSFVAALLTPVPSGEPGGSLVSFGGSSSVSGPLEMRRRM